MKQYILREYGSWGVMTLSYLTGLVVSGRVTAVICVGFAIAAYWLMHTSVVILLPLIDNLVFSITLYRLKLRFTGWLEVLKGVAFLLLMAINYA